MLKEFGKCCESITLTKQIYFQDLDLSNPISLILQYLGRIKTWKEIRLPDARQSLPFPQK